MKKLYIILIAVSLSSCRKDEVRILHVSHSPSPIQSTVLWISDHLWTYDSNNNIYSYKKSMPIITQQVIERGEVAIYLEDLSPAQGLPLILDSVRYDYSYELGQVEIKVGSSNGSITSNPGVLIWIVQTTVW